MDSILFIINPVAGSGKARDLMPLIKEIMDKYDRNYNIILTKEPKEAIYIAEENVDLYDIIVAVGGDGTVNEVAKGLINKGRGTLGIIPGGTGNDMVRSLGISIDPRESLEGLNKGVKKNIDIGRVNGHSFLNISSIGFDGEVVINQDKLRKIIKSRISYVIGIIYTLFSFKKKRIQIDVDGTRLDEDIILLAVGNGKYYGGGIKILPMAKTDDGFLRICVISGLGKIKILFLFPSVFKGNHIKYGKYVKIYKAKSINIKSEKKLYINVDGEIFPKEDNIRFEMDNKKLNVIY